MTIARKDIDDFAYAILGRRLSRAELEDLERQCKVVRLRSGEEAYLLGLVQQRDLATRLEFIAYKAVRDQTLVSALTRLRSWIAVAVIALGVIGWSVYEAGHRRGFAVRDGMVVKDLAWATTPAGLGARLLYDVGVVPFLIECKLPGWSQVEHQCVPGVDPASKRMFGVPNQRPNPSE